MATSNSWTAATPETKKDRAFYLRHKGPILSLRRRRVNCPENVVIVQPCSPGGQGSLSFRHEDSVAFVGECLNQVDSGHKPLWLYDFGHWMSILRAGLTALLSLIWQHIDMVIVRFFDLQIQHPNEPPAYRLQVI